MRVPFRFPSAAARDDSSLDSTPKTGSLRRHQAARPGTRGTRVPGVGVADVEVGRWTCEKCGRVLVASGEPAPKFRGTGAFMGPCPWVCGAWINRAFRFVKPGKVRIWRGDEWVQPSTQGWA